MNFAPSAIRVASMYENKQKLCSGLLVTDGSRVLLLMRSDGVNDPNLWGIPGGHISEGEDPLNSAIRESLEEMGGLPQGNVLKVYQIGSYKTYVWVVNPQDLESFVPVLNWEHTAYGVLPARVAFGLPEIHPGVKEVIKFYWGIDFLSTMW